MTIHIPTKVLKAALISAGKKDARPALNGVYLDPQGYVVSSDGHRLFAWRAPESWEAELPQTGVILQLADVSKAIKEAGKAKYVTVDATDVVSTDDNPALVCIGGILYNTIDGKYPDWRRVIPARPSGLTARNQGFDHRYLVDIEKQEVIMRDGTNKVPLKELTSNGAAAAVCYLGLGCVVVLMPRYITAGANSAEAEGLYCLFMEART